MDLPPPSPLIYYTLESPWPLALLIVLTGLIFLRAAMARQNRRWSAVATLVVFLGPTLVLVGSYYETNSEMLQRRTAEFVEAAICGDQELAATFLTDDLTVIVGHQGTRLTKDDIVRRIGPINLLVESNRIREVLGVATDASHGESILLQTTVPHAGFPTPNRWRFHWVRDQNDKRWRIRQLVWEEWGIGEIPSERLLGSRRRN